VCLERSQAHYSANDIRRVTTATVNDCFKVEIFQLKAFDLRNYLVVV
jgi:hypothetical protein